MLSKRQFIILTDTISPTYKKDFLLKTVSGDKDSPELKLQGVLLSDNGTVHIPDNPIIKGMICIRCLRYETGWSN